MDRREARQTLALELRRALGPPPGEAAAFVVDRLRLRSGDALLTVRRDDATATIRLVPRDPLRTAPRDIPWSRWFLLLPGRADPAAPELVGAVRDRLREGERRTLGPLLDAAFASGRTLTVSLPGACEQACVFCRDRRPARWWRRRGAGRRRRGAAGSLRDTLREARATHDAVLFQGEDALAWPDLPGLVAEATALGYGAVSVLTPGPRLDAGATVERLAAAGLDTIEVALYGATAGEHDAVTRTPGSFERLLAGVARARRADIHVIAHTALVRPVLPALAAIAALAEERDVCFERAEAVAADRGQERRYCACAPSLAEVRAALDRARLSLPRPFTLVDLPDCALPAPPDDVHVARREVGADRWPAAHAPPCAGCARQERCPGPSVAYLAAHGAADLRPFP